MSTYLDHIFTECVILQYRDGILKILLSSTPNDREWRLPRSPVNKNDDLYRAASMAIFHYTGLKKVYFDQVIAVNDSSPRISDQIMPDIPNSIPEVSIGFCVLTSFSSIRLPKQRADKIDFFSVDELPQLSEKSLRLIHFTLLKLKNELQFQIKPIAENLMPERFTMNELREMYENLLKKPLDRSNFKKRILKLGLVRDIGEVRKTGGHRSPQEFSFP